MSLRVYLFRKGRDKPANPAIECQHRELAPRWDSVADMGHTDRITHYVCTNCGAAISRAEADARGS
jgi:hypothetical protein